MQLRARAALLDIEGTLGSIAFVREVLFPYADERMDDYVRRHDRDADVRAILAEVAREACIAGNDTGALLRALHAWSAADRKVTALKTLQGLIWVEGYRNGDMRGHLYDDAVEALRRFHAAGVALYVYSSGSVTAQKLLFGHSVAGDLLPLFTGYFDTTSGPKAEAASYAAIAQAVGVAPHEMAFFSDVAGELDAAKTAGMLAIQIARPQDGTVTTHAHPWVASFADVEVLKP